MSITENRKAFHDYFVEDRYEAGLVLEGWEVKAIRAGRAQISDAYVIVDLPDNKTAAAMALAVSQSGLAATNTVVLLTPKEVDAAAKVSVKYKPPGK